MKYFRILLPLLVLALVLSACGSTVQEPYDYTFNSKTITIYPETSTIVDGLNVYRYTVEESGGDIDYVITYPNGGKFNWHQGKNISHGGWSDGYNDTLYIPGNILVAALQVHQPRERVGNVGLGLLLMALGAWHILSPESVFYLSKGWMFRDAEPADFYLTLARVGGGAFALIGLIVCFI